VGVSLDDAVTEFAASVGADGPVTVTGAGSRGGPVPGVRTVHPPSGIAWIEPEEMTIGCSAGTTVADVDAALAEHGQCVALPLGGTVGGALALGRSDVRRLGWGPVRDAVLQIRYVSAAGEVVKAGGPTVKNVSGFDLCRLLVGSRGTLGFMGDVILRTRPRPRGEQWFRSERDPWTVLAELYRPTSVLWDGTTTWILLDGHPADVAAMVSRSGLEPVDEPPPLPGHRWSWPPARLTELREDAGPFVAEIGVGIVHHARPDARPPADPAVVALHRRIKAEFDPTGRLNPGIDVLAPG
jgi:FAD/FMN-containing dehydrogenase